MLTQNSHCSFCGQPFITQAWPRNCYRCGNTTYLNPIPVAVVLLPINGGLVLIRRNTEPQKGTLTFPGGYIDSGETWQEAARRELLEETGINVSVEEISLFDVQNGLDNTLVVFGLASEQAPDTLKPFSSEETQEVVLVYEPIELGFSMHSEAMKRFFSRASAYR